MGIMEVGCVVGGVMWGCCGDYVGEVCIGECAVGGVVGGVVI